jgi:hypothetical protein
MAGNYTEQVEQLVLAKQATVDQTATLVHLIPFPFPLLTSFN